MTIKAFSNKADWLAARKDFCGGSEQAALLAADKDGGPLAIFNRKVGIESYDELSQGEARDEDPEEETSDMQRGIFYESGIARWWAHINQAELLEPWEVTGHPRGSIIVLHDPNNPNVAATPDFFARRKGEDKLRVVQVKAPRFVTRAKWDEEGTPLKYQVQVNSEGCLALANGIDVDPRFCLVRSNGDDPPVEFGVPRDAELFDIVCTKVAEFWRYHVVPKIAPPPNPFADTLSDIKRRYREVAVGFERELPAELVKRWVDLKAQEKIVNDALKGVVPSLLCELGEAEYGTVGGTRVLSCKVVDGFPLAARYQESFRRLTKLKGAGAIQ